MKSIGNWGLAGPQTLSFAGRVRLPELPRNRPAVLPELPAIPGGCAPRTFCNTGHCASRTAWDTVAALGSVQTRGLPSPDPLQNRVASLPKAGCFAEGLRPPDPLRNGGAALLEVRAIPRDCAPRTLCTAEHCAPRTAWNTEGLRPADFLQFQEAAPPRPPAIPGACNTAGCAPQTPCNTGALRPSSSANAGAAPLEPPAKPDGFDPPTPC